MKRTIKSLATTTFGSQDSELNRAGAPMPGTNTMQGENPMFGVDEKEYDTQR